MVSGEIGNQTSQNKHDQMVLKIVRGYEEKDYKIYVDILGYPKPPVIGGHRPDVLLTKGGHRTIVEVETLNTIGTHHAAIKDTAFKRACRRNSVTHYRRHIAR